MSRERFSEAELKRGWSTEYRTDTACLAEDTANRETEGARRDTRIPHAMAAIIAS